jgi:hypothetical protein
MYQMNKQNGTTSEGCLLDTVITTTMLIATVNSGIQWEVVCFLDLPFFMCGILHLESSFNDLTLSSVNQVLFSFFTAEFL